MPLGLYNRLGIPKICDAIVRGKPLRFSDNDMCRERLTTTEEELRSILATLGTDC